MISSRFALFLAVIALSSGCAHLRGNGASDPPAPSELAKLQTEVLAYAGRYRAALGFAIDSSMPYTDNSLQRLGLQGTKVSYVSSVVSSVTGPDPVLAVRDLVVGAQLQHIIWNDPKREGEYPRPAVDAVRDALRRLEADINELAGTVVRPQTLATLRAKVLEWRAANPTQDYVAFVHLDAAVNVETEAQWTEDARDEGFLAPLSEAAREIALTKETAERTLFLLNQMPMLAEWNGELLVMRTLATPEAVSAFGLGERFMVTAENLGDMVATLPARVAKERGALLQQFAQLFRLEQEATIANLSREASNLRPLLDSLSVTSMALRETSASLERLFPPTPDDAPDGGGLATVDGVVQRAGTLARDLRALIGDAQPLVAGSARMDGLAKLDAALTRHEQRLFLYGAALVVLGAGLALVVVWFARRTRGSQRQDDHASVG